MMIDQGKKGDRQFFFKKPACCTYLVIWQRFLISLRAKSGNLVEKNFIITRMEICF